MPGGESVEQMKKWKSRNTKLCCCRFRSHLFVLWNFYVGEFIALKSWNILDGEFMPSCHEQLNVFGLKDDAEMISIWAHI